MSGSPDSVAFLARELERCWPWLQAALDRNPYRTHEREHVWQLILDGRAQFWPQRNSAVVTELRTYPTGVRVVHSWLAGGELAEIEALHDRLEAMCLEAGIVWASIEGRHGWLRKLKGYRPACVTLVKRLER